MPNPHASDLHTDRRPIQSTRATLSSTFTPHEICISSPPTASVFEGENAYGRVLPRYGCRLSAAGTVIPLALSPSTIL
jgi:hypothetical protein